MTGWDLRARRYDMRKRLRKRCQHARQNRIHRCFTAIHWAHIERIVYGATINDSAKFGFNELRVSDKFLAAHQKRKIKLTGKFMRKECVDLFKEWKANKGKKY